MADGEPSGVDPRLLDRHLRRCEPCRSFADAVADDRQRLAPPAAVPDGSMPDLSRTVVRVNALADRRRVRLVLRALLAVAAAIIAVRAVPGLVAGRDQMGMVSHQARHLGAFGVAYAVGLATVVIRPARARTMLPVSVVIGVALALVAVFDAREGSAEMFTAADHLPQIATAGLLWCMTRSRTAGVVGARPARHTSVPTQPPLRMVDEREAG